MELRTELLAVSCVGDFISCQPRILLKFNNISNIIQVQKKMLLSSLDEHIYLNESPKSLLSKNILRIDKNNIYITFIILSFI